jgi:hypothetical protein
MKITHEELRIRRAFDAFFTTALAALKPHIIADAGGNLLPPAERPYVTDSSIEFVSWS